MQQKNFYLNSTSSNQETNDSEDAWESLSYTGYDKHSDSIMPTDQAQELILKKTNEKKYLKSQISSIHDEFKDRLKKILTNYSQNKETFKKIYNDHNEFFLKTPEKCSNSNKEEAEVRERLKKQQHIRINQIKRAFEENKNKVIDSKRDDLQKNWRSKMFELNGKLQQAEWKKASLQKEEKERLKSIYHKVYEQALKNEAVFLELEIEEHYSGQFQEKLKKLRDSSRVLKARIQAEFDEKFEIEKKGWVLGEENKKRICKEVEDENVKLLGKVRSESVVRFKSEFDKVYQQKRLKIEKTIRSLKPKQADFEVSEATMNDWKQEAVNEFKAETLQNSILEYKKSLTPGLTKDILRSLNLTTDSKVFKNEQEKIFKEVSEELNLTFEFFKKETENLYKKEFLEAQSAFLKDLSTVVEQKAKQKLVSKEKELHIKYIKKQEKLKNESKKEFEERFASDLKKLKEHLIKEKTLLAQQKARKNIEITKLEEKILKTFHKLEEESTKPPLKPQNPTKKTRTDSEFIFKTEEIISKSSNHNANNSSMLSPSLLKDPSQFFVPPSSSSKEIRQSIDSRQKLPNHHKKLQDSQAHSKSQLRENSKSLSFDHLKLKPKEPNKNNLIKQNVYHELLKEKFGFIMPRLK